MPRPQRLTLTPDAADADGICQSQTPSGAGNLTINGALASGGTVTFATPQHIEVSCAGSDAARTFTATGTDRYGKALTEAIAGSSASTTQGVKNFATITQIAVDAATAGAITVGVDGTCESAWLALNRITNDFNVGIAVVLGSSGNMTFTVQTTYNDLFASTFDEHAASPFSHAVIAAKTADTEGVYTSPVVATRLAITAHTAGAVTLNVIQAG